MDHDRRTFLKTTSLVAAAAAAGVPTATQAVAQARSTPGELKELPKGLVLATLRRADGYGLGLRTDRGVLDVAAADAALPTRRGRARPPSVISSRSTKPRSGRA